MDQHLDNKKNTWWQAHRPTTRRLVQFYSALLHNAYLTDSEYSGRLEKTRNLVQRALDENDIIFMGRGCCDDDCWFYGTRNSMKEELDKFVHSEENV